MVSSVYGIAMKPVQNALGGALAQGLNGLLGGLMPFEKGGAFAQGRVMPFAKGGVVSQPVSFPMRGATGLMGEAGPEAIMPLTRGADGRLALTVVGGALTDILWFRGIARLEPAAVASLGFLSPLVATLLGWLLLGQSLSLPQMLGFVTVLASVWMAQRASAG